MKQIKRDLLSKAQLLGDLEEIEEEFEEKWHWWARNGKDLVRAAFKGDWLAKLFVKQITSRRKICCAISARLAQYQNRTEGPIRRRERVAYKEHAKKKEKEHPPLPPWLFLPTDDYGRELAAS